MKNSKSIQSITLELKSSGKSVDFTNLKPNKISGEGHYFCNKDGAHYSLWNPHEHSSGFLIGGEWGYKKINSTKNTYCKLTSITR